MDYPHVIGKAEEADYLIDMIRKYVETKPKAKRILLYKTQHSSLYSRENNKRSPLSDRVKELLAFLSKNRIRLEIIEG